ncbi:TPA: hypothetical protein ACPVGA_002110, partial [Escherichia coli]
AGVSSNFVHPRLSNLTFCPEHNNSSGVGGVKIAEAFPEGRDSRGRRRLAAPCALPAPFNLYGEAH